MGHWAHAFFVAMIWTPSRFVIGIALIAAPFLTPCAKPAPSTAEDRAAITRLAAHLRAEHGFADQMNSPKWLVESSGAAAAKGRDYAHAPILQIGGVYQQEDQKRLVEEVEQWKDSSQFATVTLFFYGPPKDPEDPFSALLNLQEHYNVILDAGETTKP